MCSASVTAIGVPCDIEGEAWIVIVVEGTEAFVAEYPKPKPLCDNLYWGIPNLLDFKAIHNLRTKKAIF